MREPIAEASEGRHNRLKDRAGSHQSMRGTGPRSIFPCTPPTTTVAQAPHSVIRSVCESRYRCRRCLPAGVRRDVFVRSRAFSIFSPLYPLGCTMSLVQRSRCPVCKSGVRDCRRVDAWREADASCVERLCCLACGWGRLQRAAWAKGSTEMGKHSANELEPTAGNDCRLSGDNRMRGRRITRKKSHMHLNILLRCDAG